VTLSHHQLRLTPRALPHQHSQAYELALTPVPAYRCQRLDAFGNSVIEIAIESAHSELEIVARSTVELSQREVPPAEKQRPGKPSVRRSLIAPASDPIRRFSKPRGFFSNRLTRG
jgi:hypothetical protein